MQTVFFISEQVIFIKKGCGVMGTVTSSLYRKHSADRSKLRRMLFGRDVSSALALVTLTVLVEIIFDNYERVRLELGMAKRVKEQKFKWRGYINIDIPDARRDEARLFIEDTELVLQGLEEVIADGYKVSLRKDTNSEGVTATLTCHQADSDNFGFAMSGFAGDGVSALGVVVFKHYRISEGDWESDEKVGRDAFG